MQTNQRKGSLLTGGNPRRRFTATDHSTSVGEGREVSYCLDSGTWTTLQPVRVFRRHPWKLRGLVIDRQ